MASKQDGLAMSYYYAVQAVNAVESCQSADTKLQAETYLALAAEVGGLCSLKGIRLDFPLM